MDAKFSKTTIAPGWAELRVVVPRVADDSPDFAIEGVEARERFTKFVLAYAAGFACARGRFELEADLFELASGMVLERSS
jgi:hypothetical protein